MQHPTTLEEFNAILTAAGDKLVAVDFTATWCPPCRMIGPKFEEMQKSFAKDKKEVIFVKVDVEEGQEIAELHNVTAMPTFMFFKRGEMVDMFTGASESMLVERLNTLSQSPTGQSTKT